jgi:tRNA1Val (adenine37-N6)-methyltransferase
VADPQEVTRDALFSGRLPLAQLRSGYRTNVDALWLAAFAARDRPSRACVDLGSGVGAVGLALVVSGAAQRATLIDIACDAIELATDNARDAGMSDRIDVDVLDLRNPLPAERMHKFDLVVANPPWSPGSRPSPRAHRATARTGDDATLPGFVRAARAALGAAGRVCFVYPSNQLAVLICELSKVGLEPKRLRLVHPLPDAPARAVLVEAKPARPGGLRVESPFVAMRSPGEWTDEAARIIAGQLR